MAAAVAVLGTGVVVGGALLSAGDDLDDLMTDEPAGAGGARTSRPVDIDGHELRCAPPHVRRCRPRPRVARLDPGDRSGRRAPRCAGHPSYCRRKPFPTIPKHKLHRPKWNRCVQEFLARQDGSVAVAICVDLIGRIHELAQRAAQLEREIAALVVIHGPQLLALEGCGPLSAARILAETGDIRRFHLGRGLRDAHRHRTHPRLVG